MIIESDKPDQAGLPAAYQTLSSFEKSLVHLASIIYEPVNRITFANCLRRARITGPQGGMADFEYLGPIYSKTPKF